MHLFKTKFIRALVFFTLLFTCSSVNAYEFENLNIENIILPSSYSSCTRETLSGGFKSFLTANGYTHAQWVEDVMLPKNLYVCARNSQGDMINISFSDPTKEDDKNKDLKFHRLMYDYNLHTESEKAVQNVLVDYRDTLKDSGINTRKIKHIKWFNKGELSEYTPYIRSIFEDESGINVCEYATVYDGNSIKITLLSQKDLNTAEIKSLEEIARNIKHTSQIDYSQAKQVHRQNQRVQIPDRIRETQKSSAILVVFSILFVISVLCAAVVITTNKLRHRTRSKKNTLNGKY